MSKNISLVMRCAAVILVLLLAACSSTLDKAAPLEPQGPQIVGGTEATPGAYPFMVQLKYTGSSEPNDHWCGGSLLERTWVLTAAHCVQGRSLGDFTVVLGEHTRSVNEGVEQVVSIQRAVVFPDYSSTSLDNDIALLELTSPATLNARADLAERGTLPGVGESLRVIGWGSINEGGPASDILLQVDVPLVSDAECEAAYSGRITDSMFCAGFEAGARDSCSGDSGGPVFDGNERQVGIVSWGNGCARSDAYGVYTNVAQFATWIDNTINPPVPTDSEITFRVSPHISYASLSVKSDEGSYSAYDGKTLTLTPGTYTVSGSGYDSFPNHQYYEALSKTFTVEAGKDEVISVSMRLK